MGFQDLLNWITGRRPPVEPTPAPGAARERRRFQRIDLSDGVLTVDEAGPFPVTNLSYGGLRFDLKGTDQPPAFPAGRVFAARVTLFQSQMTVSLKVCNVLGTLVGCSFENLSPVHSRLIGDFLKPRIIGASLQEINASALQNREPGLRLRWFQGDDGAQVFLWQTLEGEAVKQEYYFLDYVITWDNRQRVLQTGKMRTEAGKAGYGRIDPSAVAFFQVPSHRALKMGKVILENSSLPPEVRDPMLNGIVREERRLYQRYVLRKTDAGLRFFPGTAREGALPVANLSFNGLAVALPEENLRQGLVRGQILEGELQIGDRFLPVRVVLAYVTPQVAGGFMKVLDEAQGEVLAAYLAPRLLGQALEEMPAPVDETPFAPAGARSYLFVGLHNPHLLTMVAPGLGGSSGAPRLVHGRIAFMDKVLSWERSALAAYTCPCGVVFPRDWDLPPDLVERLPAVPADLVEMCRLMVEAAPLPEEVKAVWGKALGG